MGIYFVESNELDVATGLISNDGARESKQEFQMQDPNLVIPTSLTHKLMSNAVSMVSESSLSLEGSLCAL